MVFGDYAPQNILGTFQGEVPMYEAVAQSLNMPAVWLLNEIGLRERNCLVGKVWYSS